MITNLLFFIITIILIQGCSNSEKDTKILKHFNKGKQLRCYHNNRYIMPNIVTNNQWKYNFDLQFFYNTNGEKFNLNNCEIKF